MKYIACGNIFKLNSIYSWKGRIEQAGEYGVFMKTSKSNYSRVEEFILQNHPYEVPEIISWSIERGMNKYLAWIGESVVGKQ